MIENRRHIISEAKRVGYKHLYHALKNKRKNVYEDILAHALRIRESDLPFMEKVFLYYWNMNARPRCLQCCNRVKTFYSFERGYGMFCSTKCSSANEALRKKISSSRDEQEIASKRAKTMFEKYSTDNLATIRWNK